MYLDQAITLAVNSHCQGWNFGARGLCLEVLKREPDRHQAAALLELVEPELIKQPPCDRRIFVFGDSHSESFDGPKSVFELAPLGARTMYRMGHGGLDEIELGNFGVRDGDCATFVFGEIDVRLHIGRIRDQQERSLDDILEDLVTGYIGAITRTRAGFAELDCLVTAVVPPIGIEHRPNLPEFFYGETVDRLEIALRLNLKLEQECRVNGVGFVDLYSPFADEQGLMDPAYLDDLWHVRKEFHPISRAAVVSALTHLRGNRV